MPRWFVGLCLGIGSTVASACNDELVEDVTKDVCYSEKRWIGGKRGSAEMYPGRDCVGCHLENDGPPLAAGGTIYPYVISDTEVLSELQSGEDCFGIEGVVVTITDGEGQTYELTTNRAGNFYVEGNPDDFAKPFTAALIDWVDGDQTTSDSPMGTMPSYGGCARCHTPGTEANFEGIDDEYVAPTTRIGLPGYTAPGADVIVENELRALVGLPPR